MTSQCLSGQHIGDVEFLCSEISIWSEKTTEKQRGVDGQFKIDNARENLSESIPKLNLEGGLGIHGICESQESVVSIGAQRSTG